MTLKWIQVSFNKDIVRELGINSLFQPHTHNLSINWTQGKENKETHNAVT